ncbi:uncharacterized protein [Chironomus tepperi]|uniref:uncharacterized protein n=1 Tax=Chironomus tepperi TaxID=113505 RepID=UPI00391F5F95
MKLVGLLSILSVALTVAHPDASHILLSNQSKNQVNPNFIKAIEILMDNMLKSYYKSIYYVAAINNHEDEYFINLKSSLIQMTCKNYAFRFDIFFKMERYVKKKRQNSIFLIDTIENFRAASWLINPERFRINGNFLFVLINGHFDEIEEIFETLWKKNIHSIYLIYEHEGEIILSTFSPFANSSSCGSTKPQIVAKFENGSFNAAFSIPKRITNLQGCPLRIVTFAHPGYVNVRKMLNGSQELYGRGIIYMNVLADALNYTNEVKLGKGEMPWGIIYENGTITGNFGDLHKNYADIAFSEHYMKAIRAKYFDYSLTQYTTQMVFIIPPGKPYNYLEKLLRPYHHYVWVILTAILIVAILVISLINLRFKHLRSFIFGRNVKHPITNLIIAIFGSQQTVVPGRNFARYMLMMFLMLCLVLRNIYQGSLFQFLQSDKRHKEVQTIDEMIRKDFTFYMYETALDVLQNYTEIYKRAKVFNSSQNFLLTSPLKGGENYAGLDSLIKIQAQIYNGSNIKYCKESLITFNIVLYFRKGFFLRDEIDRKLDGLVSSGIFNYWIKNSSKYHGYPQHEHKHPRNITLDDLRGPFVILLLGNFLSAVLFISELLHHRRKIRMSINVNQVES